jgi:squalene-associated FAD-dependent desaturase
MTAGAPSPAIEVDIVGGGLAGLAAAVALATTGCRLRLFEARRTLGGRATSFRDPATGQFVDQCQHVGMACCTNLLDFCRRTGIATSFQRDPALNFIGPDGHRVVLRGAGWLPAPLHLAPSLWRLRYLSGRERLAIARALWKLMRTPLTDAAAEDRVVGEWLAVHGQTPRTIELFWNVILNSALGESLDRASLSAARKVLVDGFMANRHAYELEIPAAPLGEVYGRKLESWLQTHGVQVHLGSPLRSVKLDDGGPCLELADGRMRRPRFVVLALPWSKLSSAVEPSVAAQWPWLSTVNAIEGAPITAVHLWFDRPITDLPHAVLIGRLSQWVFRRGEPAAAQGDAAHPTGHYYQVVISASRQLAGRARQNVIDEVRGDLAAVWPAASEAKLLTARMVTESQAVFSAIPGLDRVRPAQQTAVPGLLVAGDWTATGWPATMESAVRSGYLAAEAVLHCIGRPRPFLVPDLPRGWLARVLIAG